jgi:hypothetical protein
MKFPKLILCMSMFAAVFLLTACGKDDEKTVATATATTCQAGYSHSATYGCLPQGYCPAGYATYNNQCVVASAQSANGCQAGYVWNGSSCVVSGNGTGNSCPYPGTYESQPGWCSCLPGLRPQANGCY